MFKKISKFFRQKKVKNSLYAVRRVLFWTLAATALLMTILTVISVTAIDKNERNISGYKFFIVQSNSMSTVFNEGDVIICSEVDESTLSEGDIITFISQNSASYSQVITHKIRKVTTDANGNIAFVTYGTATNTDDEALATQIIGKYTAKIPYIGYLFSFLKTTQGYVICIFIPLLLLIITQEINCIRLFEKYKYEQHKEKRFSSRRRKAR